VAIFNVRNYITKNNTTDINSIRCTRKRNLRIVLVKHFRRKEIFIHRYGGKKQLRFDFHHFNIHRGKKDEGTTPVF